MAAVQNNQQPEVPVYLFTGFLEGGKTRFVQETLQDKGFDTGERTLLIVCEEGELDYEPAKFLGRVTIRTVEDESELTPSLLEAWDREVRPQRVLTEYNGMWMLDRFYQAMPQRWAVYQEFMFAEAGTFQSYNANMRQLVFDKLRSCDLVVFNRFDRTQDIMPWHKIVRAVNRGCDIAYEDVRGKVRYDDIVDPLPFDKNAPVIEIADRDYALWYRDLNEDMRAYEGKTVHFKAQIALGEGLKQDELIVGRQLMNCCAADVTFAGMIAVGNTRLGLANRDWVELTASIRIRRHPGYSKPGPVLTVKELSPAAPAEEPVATFY